VEEVSEKREDDGTGLGSCGKQVGKLIAIASVIEGPESIGGKRRLSLGGPAVGDVRFLYSSGDLGSWVVRGTGGG